MKYLILGIVFLGTLKAFTQTDDMNELNKLPYYEIPAYPEDYSAGNVVARVVDGLGYRYYWATEGLGTEDFNYKPSEDSRTIGETMQHIFGLTRMTEHVVKNEVIEQKEVIDYTPEEQRKMTLENIQRASNILKGKTAEELAELAIVFKRADRSSEFPFWNLLNGPLADAIYHTGQIVAFRRAAGNPVDFRMNVFTGKNRE